MLFVYGCYFVYTASFNVAHWLFAFHYWALSYRVELVTKKLPEDAHNCKFSVINLLVCLINVALAAWVWYNNESYYSRLILSLTLE
jgi:hypothetical protein